MGRHDIVNLAGRVSHQSLLLQAQDDQIENKKAERQYAAIQNPELADSVSQEGGDDEVLSKHPCGSNTTAARSPSSTIMKASYQGLQHAAFVAMVEGPFAIQLQLQHRLP